MKNLKKFLPYIIVNLTGAVLAVLSLFFDIIETPLGFIYAIPFLPTVLCDFLEISGFAVIIVYTVLNIIALALVVADKSVAGLIFAVLPGGSFGAFVGTFPNRNFKYKKIVRIIFNVYAWLCVCGFCSLLFIVSHFWHFG